MNKISKMNFLGFALTVSAFAASSAMLGCAPPAPRTSNNPGIGNIPPSVSNNFPINNTYGSLDLNTMSAAEVASFLVNYGGSINVLDNEGREVNQAYTLNLTRGTLPSEPGKSFPQFTFTSGNQRMSGIMRGQSFPYYGKTVYVWTSYAQNAPTVFPDAPVIMQIEIAIDSNNQFDPASSSIRIVEADGWSFPDVVYFNDDFARR